MADLSYYSTESVGEILVKSLRFYCDRFSALFLPFLITSLIESVLWNLAFSLIPHFDVQPGFTENFLVQFINYLTFVTPIVVSFALISWVINALPAGLIVKYSSDILERRPSSLISSLKRVTYKIPSLLSVGLIQGLLVILGLVLLVIPGIIIAVVFSLAIQAAIIEDSGIIESLRKSKKLVAKRPLKAFSILLFMFLLTTLGGAVGETLCSRLIIVEGYIRLLIISIAISAAKPLQPIALTYLYYSLSAGQKLEAERGVYPPVYSAPQQMGQKMTRIEYHPKFCYKCGQKLPSDAIYCPRCGVRVKA